jgi:RNA polymerase sigma-70 factor (ECF subfamily)
VASATFRSEPSPELPRWLEAARAGSPEALGRLLEGCRQYLLLVANDELPSDLRPKVGASDLVQETFLRAQDHFAQFRGTTAEELLGWLRRILLNHLANVTRHYRATDKRQLAREVPLAETPPGALRDVLAAVDESPRARLAAREEADELEKALAGLSEEYRRVIRWRNREDLSFEEIGRRLGRSADAARKLWARAVEQLQELLEPGDASP